MSHFFQPLDEVPFREYSVCAFHKANPGAHVSCTCSLTLGTRKATPEELKVLLRQRTEAADKEIARLEAYKQMLPGLMGVKE